MGRPGYVKVATADELPSGSGKLVMGPLEKPIALFNVDGGFLPLIMYVHTWADLLEKGN